MRMKTLLVAAWAVAASVGFGKTLGNGFTYDESGDIVPGKWNSQYQKARDYAAENDCPIVAFWAATSCGYCKKLETSIAESKTFAKWAEDRGYVLLFGYGTSGDNGKTKLYCSDASGKFPYVSVSWEGREIGKAAGTVHQKGKVGTDFRLTFSGRSGFMPVSGATLADQFMNSVDKYLSGYSPIRNSSFIATTEAKTETVGNRYECDKGTKTVSVVISREKAEKTLVEQFVVVNPQGGAVTNKLTWAVNEVSKTNTLDLAGYDFKKAGDRLTLQILNDKGGVASETHVTYVEKETSAANPKWIGEEFGFGEWTSDIDAATNFVAKAEGAAYTLVSIQGSLWCPDCANTERNFLELEDKDGNNKFSAWAKANNIALVSMDIPNYQGPNVTDRSTPTLFSIDAYKTTLARAKEYPQAGAPAELTNAVLRSGLGYLTRKGVSDAAAEKQLKKFHDLAYLNTDKGGFHRPEDGNKNRTGVPIFVLLRKDGSVAARFTRFASVSPMAADKANFANYLKRFEEMMVLSKVDATEIENNFPRKDHPLTMAANDDSVSSTLCNADFQDAVKLVGLTGGAKETLTIRGASTAAVTVQMYMMAKDGTVSSASNPYSCTNLLTGLKFDFETKNTEKAEYFALVKGADITSAAFDAASAVDDHFITYMLKSSTVYQPIEAAQEGVTDTKDKALFSLTSNAVYRITKVDPAACVGVLESKGDDFYRALVTGESELSFLSGTSPREEFVYQLWKPGKVGFVKDELTVTESVNDKENDYVMIALSRTGGASGAVSVSVSLDASTDLYNLEWDEDEGKVVRGDPRFDFDDPTVVTWPDGVSSNMFVRVRVKDDSEQPRYDDNGKVVLKMSDPVGPAMDVEKGTDVFTLYVTEDDRADPGRAMFTRVDPYYAKAKTVYVRENEGAFLYAKRIEGSEGLFGVEVKSSLADATFTTANERDLSWEGTPGKEKRILWWSSKESDEKYLCVSNVPAGKSAKITINNYKSGDIDAKVVSASNTVTVVGVAANAPEFEVDSASDTLYRYVAFEKAYGVVLPDGSVPTNDLSFTKLSGSLPTGLSVKYDKTKQAMVVTGVPTATDSRTGVKSFDAVYQVTETRLVNSRKTKVAGLTIRLSYKVVDPVVTGAAGGDPLNDFFKKSRTYSDLMVLDPASGSLIGTLTLTMPSTGKASGKLKCIYGTLSYSAKSWSEIDPVSGDLKVVLACTTKDYKSSEITVVANDEGALDVTVSAVSGETWTIATGKFWSSDESAKDYQGTYTVALPVSKIGVDPCGLAPRGTPYISLTMTSSSQWNKGTMKWAGVLANGQSVSGSAVLMETKTAGDDIACLPVFSQSTKDVFGAIAAIAKGAKARSDKGESKDCYRAITEPTFATVRFGDITVKPYWSHTENSKTVTNAVWEITYDLYGSIYNLKNGLDCCCDEVLGTRYLTLRVSTNLVSTTYGQLGPVNDLRLYATEKTIKSVSGQDNPQSVSFSVNSSGIVSGSFKTPYVDQNGRTKTLSASYKGVVLIGWGAECGECHEGEEIDLPFIMGGWWVTDKYEYDEAKGKTISVKHGDAVVGEKTTIEE